MFCQTTICSVEGDERLTESFTSINRRVQKLPEGTQYKYKVRGVKDIKVLLTIFVNKMKRKKQTIWETDKNRKKFLSESSQELKNSTKRFKKRRESVQIRLEKEAYGYLKSLAKRNGKTILYTASTILHRLREKHNEFLLYILLSE